MRKVSAETGRPVTFALVQLDVEPDHWERMFDLSEEAVAEGADLYPQVTARAPGGLLGLQTNHPWINTATFQEISGHYKLGAGDVHHLRSTSLDNIVDELKKPEVKERMMGELPEARQDITFITMTRVFPLSEPLNYEPTEDESIAAIAEREVHGLRSRRAQGPCRGSSGPLANYF